MLTISYCSLALFTPEERCAAISCVQYVRAVVHCHSSFSPYVETTEYVGEVEIKCAVFAAATGTHWIYLHAISDCWRPLRHGRERQTSLSKEQSPVPPAEASC